MTTGLERVPREFAGNRFLGLHAALEVFQEALGRRDEPACSELVGELSDGGYPSWPFKDDLLIELHDVALVRHQGIDRLLDHYEELRLRAVPPGDPVAHRGLGLLFQATEYLDIAQDHYERSLRLWEATGDPRAQEVRDLLVTLEHQRHEGERHPFFIQRWAPIEAGRVDTRRMLRDVVTAALAGPDWRLGREAVAALERLGDWQALEQVLGRSNPRVQVAALAALRRHGARSHEGALLAALSDTSPVVRWQAALLLGADGVGAVGPLIERLRQDTAAPSVRAATAESLGRLAGTSPQRSRAEAALRDRLEDADPNTQVAAAIALGNVGDRQTLPALRAPRSNVSDFRGRSLADAMRQATAQIERRFPAPPAAPKPAPPARTPAPFRPTAPPPSPAIRSRTPIESQRYVRRAFALKILHVGVGAAVIGMVDFGMALGYLLYAAVARRLVEPFAAPFNFFAGKPCYTGRPAQGPRSGWLRSRIRPALVYLPLFFSPLITNVLLVVREASLFSKIAWVPLTLHFVLSLGRAMYLVTAACPFCSARSQCPVGSRIDFERFPP